MILPVITFFIVFSYLPMHGVLMAFQDYNISKGIWGGSQWIGLQNFIDFFNSPYFFRVVRNTLVLNFYGLIFVFPMAIIFALLINEIRHKLFKRTMQTVSYLPYFISIVVISGIIHDFTSQDGLLTFAFKFITGVQGPMNLLTMPQYFRTIYIVSDIWQFVGFNSIIYISAISGINPELYEAAIIDGAGRWRQMIHITFAGIVPTITILFILQIGNIMNVGFDKVFLLYNPAIFSNADVISTYIYRQGLQAGQYSYSTSVGLFNSVVNFLLLISVNKLSKKVNEISLF